MILWWFCGMPIPDEVSFTLEDVNTGELVLHPLLTDAHNSQASYDAESQTFTLPGRSTAVFVRENGINQPAPEPTVAASEPNVGLESTKVFPAQIEQSDEAIGSSNLALILIGGAALLAIGVGASLWARRKQ